MHPAHRSRPRALRIGVVLGDTLIAEQTLETGSFTIGQKASCSVPLPVAELPARWELLTIDGRGPRLRLGDGMDVRLADGGAVRTRADLAAAGGAAAGGEHALEVAIPASGRGKVMLGDVKVMFHVVDVAPRAPRPSLPPELRETLAQRVDRRLLIFAVASLAIHVGVMTAARLNDPPAELSSAEQVMADYVAETATVIDADELPPLTTEPEPSAPAPAVQAPTSKPSTPLAPAERPRAPRAPSTSPATIDPSADAARAADALFSADPHGDQPGDAARRKPSDVLGKQLDELAAQQARASLGPAGDRELPHSDGPRLGTTAPTGPQVGDITHTAPPKPVPPPDIKLYPPAKRPPGEPSIDPIVAKIKTAYMPGLVRCYKRAMTEGGALSGKVVLAFAVNEHGSVGDASATGVDEGLERCVEGLMSGWRFPPIVDGDGDATDVDVKLTLQLRPD